MTNNIELVSTFGLNSAVLFGPAGSVLQINSGYGLSSSGTGTGVPQVLFIGDEVLRVRVTRQGSGTYSFNMSTSQCNFGAVYTDFEYMDGNGINVTAATIDATYNFSNCIFSNYLRNAGTLLRLPNQDLPSIYNTRFFFNGTPTVGTHFNVFRSGAGSGQAVFVEFTGNFAGQKFERDPTGRVTHGNIVWQASLTTVYWGPFSSGNWNDSPSKWRDITGNVVPVPTNTQNVVLDHTHEDGPYTITLSGTTVNARTVRMNSESTHPILLVQPSGVTFNLTGGFEMASTLDRFESNGQVSIRGNWLTNQGSYVPGTNALVVFLTNSAYIASGTNSFSQLTINAPGRVITLQDKLTVTRAFILSNGTLDVSSTNNTISFLGKVSFNSGAFIANLGTVEFAGGSNQTIVNPLKAEFYNLSVNKSAGNIILSNDIYVNGTLNFSGPNKAMINTGNLVVRMGLNAQATGANAIGSNGYVNGKMSFKYNSTSALFSRTFTVGSFPDYMPIELSVQLASPTVTEFLAEVVNAAPTSRTLPTAPAIAGHSSAHHFKINKLSATDVAAAKVTLPYKVSDLTSMGIVGNIVDVSTIRILKSNSSDNTLWDDITVGSSGANGDLTSGTITSSTNWTTFSDFVVAATPQPMPVELLSFEGSYNPNSQAIDLVWMTSGEQNNAGFAVIRAETIGGHYQLLDSYQTLTSLGGQGTTVLPMQYSYTDSRSIIPGQTYYYRLEQVDFSGQKRRSETIAVTVPGAGSRFIGQYPNPVGATSYFQLYLDTDADVQLSIYNLNGQRVAQFEEHLSSGNRVLAWPTANLEAGLYLYQLTGGGLNQNGKLVLLGK